MGKDSKLSINTGIIKSVIAVIAVVAVIAVILFDSVFFEQELADKDKVNMAFSTAEGTEYDSPTGLRVEVKSISEDIEAELRLDAVILAEPEQDGIVDIYGNYDIDIFYEQDLAEHPEVKLSFTVPSELDAKDALLLYKGPEGYGLPGGSVEVTDREIILEVPELSSFVLVAPHDHGSILTLNTDQSETALTEEGHAEVIVKLEAVESAVLGFGSSPWFSLEAVPVVNQLSVEAPSDWLFDQFTPRKSYLGPMEQKDLVYTFYGTGGESTLRLSASSWDAMVMTWIDALHRLATGDPLPWPVGPGLLEESEELALLMSLYEHLQAESQQMEEEEWRGITAMGSTYNIVRYLWEETRNWALAQGAEFLIEIIGNVWWRFARTADLFVGQVVYALAGETEHFYGFYVNTRPVLRIEPEQGEITAGESFQLEANLENPDGKLLSVPMVGWEVSGGGIIDSKGLLNSDDNADGEYTVTASVRNVVDTLGDMKILEESVIITIDSTELEQVFVDVDAGSNLFIRKTPGTKDKTSDDIIDRVPRGRLLKVIDKHDNNVVIDNFTWWEVYDSKGEQKGWVASEYLSVKKEIFAYDASVIFTGDDFSIQVKDKKITAKSKKEEIIELLGEPEDIKSYDEFAPIVILEYTNIELGFLTEGVGVKEGCFSISTNSLEVTGPRNIRVGDSYESVIEKFPDEENPKDTLPEPEQYEDRHYRRVLYGEVFHLSDYGKINYNKDNEPISIIYGHGPITLYIDLENGKVAEISLSIQLT